MVSYGTEKQDTRRAVRERLDIQKCDVLLKNREAA